jgi:DNA-binding CsgD family transcriptional regulator
MTNATKAKSLKEYNESILTRLQELCEPLNTFDISNFSYAKLTKEQKFFRIGNHERYTNFFFEQVLYDHPDFYRGLRHPEAFSTEKQTLFFLWDPHGSAQKMRMSLDMWNGISFYFITKDYIEGCAFGGTLQNTGLGDFYLNNLDILKKFFMYFKSAAKDLIDISDKNKILDISFQDKTQNPYTINSEKIIEFNKKIFTKRYPISSGQNEFNLTLREIECLLYKSQGLTAKQIARECNISPRTVETHFNKILFKSGLSHMNQLINLCKEEGLL